MRDDDCRVLCVAVSIFIKGYGVSPCVAPDPVNIIVVRLYLQSLNADHYSGVPRTSNVTEHYFSSLPFLPFPLVLFLAFFPSLFTLPYAVRGLAEHGRKT